MKIRAIIIDDEKPARSRIKRLMSKFDGFELAGEAQNGEEGIELIEEIHPDVVFLDIKMPRLTGFEMLNRLEKPPYIVFITAYDKYALKAFEENTLDYLLKPVSEEDFSRAVSKISGVLHRNETVRIDYKNIVSAIEKNRNLIQRFSVKLGSKIFLVSASDVYFFHSEDKQTFLNTKDRDFIIPFTLKELEERLDPDSFSRVHRAYIVNINHVSSIHTWFGGRLMIKLKNDREVIVSRNYTAAFKEKINL
ncbi:MAG: response regulator [bacterium]|nr:response regulator [bacterium]